MSADCQVSEPHGERAAELGFSAEHEAVVNACPLMQDQIIDVVMALHAAANEAIAAGIKAPKKKRSKR